MNHFHWEFTGVPQVLEETAPVVSDDSDCEYDLTITFDDCSTTRPYQLPLNVVIDGFPSAP